MVTRRKSGVLVPLLLGAASLGLAWIIYQELQEPVSANQMALN